MPTRFNNSVAIDTGTIYLLRRIDKSGGSLTVTYEDIAALEEEQFLRYANDLRLVRVDFGSEWTSGGVISITRRGRGYLEKPDIAATWGKLVKRWLGTLTRSLNH